MSRKIYVSKSGEYEKPLRGTAKDLTHKYENFAVLAEREKNYQEAHNFYQHAEHYRRETGQWRER